MTMRDLAHHVIAVAHDSGLPVTNLQLQKVMYFSLKRALNDDLIESNLIDETYDQPFLVWRYGPVEKDIYDTYKIFGSDPITENSKQVDAFTPLNEVIGTYLSENPFNLVEESHNEPFWQEHQGDIVGWRSNVEYQLDDVAVEI